MLLNCLGESSKCKTGLNGAMTMPVAIVVRRVTATRFVVPFIHGPKWLDLSAAAVGLALPMIMGS